MNTDLKQVVVNGTKYLVGTVEPIDGKIVIKDALEVRGVVNKNDFRNYAVAEQQGILVTKTFSGNGVSLEEIPFDADQQILLKNAIDLVDLALTKWQGYYKAEYIQKVFQ